MPLDLLDRPTTSTATVPELLGKLEALGHHDIIAAFLASEGIKGVRGNPSTCAVAVYLRRDTGQAIDVGMSHAHCWNGAEATDAYSLPEVVCDFVAAFDAGEYPGLQIEMLEWLRQTLILSADSLQAGERASA